MTLSFNVKNGAMKFVLPSSNHYLKTRSGRHINISQQQIIIYLPLSYQANLDTAQKTIKHSQDHSVFIYPKMKLLIPQKHQNHMSKSLSTWILTTDLTFLLPLYLQWVLNLEYLKPNINNLWSILSLAKGKPFYKYTLEKFRPEMKIFC